MRPNRRHLVLVTVAILATVSAASAWADDATTAPPTDAAASLPHDLDGEIARVRLMRGQGDYADAIRNVAQLMLVAPDDPRVVSEYGKALVQAGRAREAVDFLKRAIQLKDDDWTLYSALGVAEDQLGRTRLADEAYRHALNLKPDEPSVLNNLALSLMSTGNLGEAETLLRQAQAHGGDDPRILENLKRIADLRGITAPPPPGPQSQLRQPQPVAVAPLGHAAPTPDATRTPRALAAAQTAPRRSAPPVIMAKIPYDPLAGKHYPLPHEKAVAQRSSKRRAHLASAEPAKKPADKPVEQTPILRTAADVY